ncbi:MAG: hypothetical protein Q8Q23_04105 [bacterium]|nr:hypothetical protein [bacterium]
MKKFEVVLIFLTMFTPMFFGVVEDNFSSFVPVAFVIGVAIYSITTLHFLSGAK